LFHTFLRWGRLFETVPLPAVAVLIVRYHGTPNRRSKAR
jgi:hypothetical protein